MISLESTQGVLSRENVPAMGLKIKRLERTIG